MRHDKNRVGHIADCFGHIEDSTVDWVASFAHSAHFASFAHFAHFASFASFAHFASFASQSFADFPSHCIVDFGIDDVADDVTECAAVIAFRHSPQGCIAEYADTLALDNVHTTVLAHLAIDGSSESQNLDVASDLDVESQQLVVLHEEAEECCSQ